MSSWVASLLCVCVEDCEESYEVLEFFFDEDEVLELVASKKQENVGVGMQLSSFRLTSS